MSDRLCGLVVRVLDYRCRGPGFYSRALQKKVMDLERGPLSLVSTTEELLDRKSSGSCLENREYGRRNPSRWPRGTFYPQKLAITSPISGGRSVGIVRSRTQTMEFSFFSLWLGNVPSCGPFSELGTAKNCFVRDLVSAVVWQGWIAG
jgi:hypothetical protein